MTCDFIGCCLTDVEHPIDDSQLFPSMLKEKTTYSLDEEYMPYDVESLFSNIPKGQTNLYIISFFYLIGIHST